MLPEPSFWHGRRVCVTGGTGFLGWQIVCQLQTLGADVRILALPPDPIHPASQLDEGQTSWGDVRDPAVVRRATDGCSVVFHTAGVVAAWGKVLEHMQSIHCDGTNNVLKSAPKDARIVHTSSITTIGACRRGSVLNEDSSGDSHSSKLAYICAKHAAEQIALNAAAAGRDVVTTNPGYLIGPEDYQQSVMGRFCVRFWRGRIPVAPSGGLNLADVRDVATGHLLAAEHGVSGRRYILGGENHYFRSFLRSLALVSNCRPRALPCVPWFLMAGLAVLTELRGKLTGREPYPSMAHVRLNRRCWFGDSTRATRELGYSFRPLLDSLRDAYHWHRSNRPIKPRGLPRWWLRPATQAA